MSTTTSPLVRRSPVAARHCNLAAAFELIGDRWTLLILRSALYGVRRFDDFRADLKIPRSVLANRLTGVVESGVMEEREYREIGQRTRIEYLLTKMGSELALPFIAMTSWGDKWLGAGKSPLTFRSKANGHRLRIALVDENDQIAKASEIDPVVALKFRRSTDKADIS